MTQADVPNKYEFFASFFLGVHKDDRSKMFFRNGFNEMLKRVSPDAVVLYGDVSEWVMKLMPKQLDIHLFQYERFNKLRKYGR